MSFSSLYSSSGYTIIPSYLSLNHCCASSFFTRCFGPIRDLQCFLLPTRAPARLNTTQKFIPKIPVDGSYFIPKSMCSVIPKPKHPREHHIYNHRHAQMTIEAQKPPRIFATLRNFRECLLLCAAYHCIYVSSDSKWEANRWYALQRRVGLHREWCGMGFQDRIERHKR